MEAGSVFRAQEKMKWVWFIPIIIAFVTHIVLKHEMDKNVDYWFLFIVIGVIWNMAITSYVIGRIWRKVKARFVSVMVKKTINYHRMSIKALIDKDYPKAKLIIDKCLPRYDPSSIMTHFIFGAYVMGTEDTKQLNHLLDEIKNTGL